MGRFTSAWMSLVQSTDTRGISTVDVGGKWVTIILTEKPLSAKIYHSKNLSNALQTMRVNDF